MSDETLSENMHNALSLLQRHGVEIRVPSVEEFDAMRVDQLQGIVDWFEDPKRYPKPREIQPAVRLVKGAKS